MENNKKKSKKKTIIIVIVCVIIIVLAIGAYLIFGNKSTGEGVYVSTVGQITGHDSGSVNQFSGVVEAADTVDYKLDSGKTLKTTYVEVGDEVKKGDKLFAYDGDSIQLEIDQLNIDIEKLQATIDSDNKQIEKLTKEKESASSDQQLDYSLQIQSLQNDISSNQYTIKTKNNELKTKKTALCNIVVVSTIDGVVKSINSSSDASAYISIMSDGEFSIKTSINELNIYQMSEGTPVNVYSRIDDSVWSGVVSKIDNSPNSSSNNNLQSSTSDSSSSNYYFYVTLDSYDGLFLGQHVIVKEASSSKDGMWLSEYYIVDADTNPYVFKASNGKLVKQSITLGEYDSDLCEYEILSGLDYSDSIAYPDESVSAGMSVVSE